MRKELKKINNHRMRFSAIVERFGTKSNWHGFPEPTILLKNIIRIDTGEIVSDHLWFAAGISWQECKEGDIVEFDARVGDYIKGYVNERQLDCRLKNPTKIIIKE